MLYLLIHWFRGKFGYKVPAVYQNWPELARGNFDKPRGLYTRISRKSSVLVYYYIVDSELTQDLWKIFFFKSRITRRALRPESTRQSSNLIGYSGVIRLPLCNNIQKLNGLLCNSEKIERVHKLHERTWVQFLNEFNLFTN